MVKQKIWGSILIYTKNRLVLGLIIKSNYIYIYIYGSVAQAYSGYHAKNWWSFQHFWWPSKEPCKNKANPFLLQFKFTKSLQLRMCMGQVKGIIWPNPPWWVKKNLTQPNPHGSSWVGLNPWVGQIYYYYYYYYYYQIE